MPPNPGLAFAPGVGDGSLSLCVDVRPLGVHSFSSATGVDSRANLEGVVVVAIFVGDGFGVDCRNGDGECGLSGRRKGDALGEP